MSLRTSRQHTTRRSETMALSGRASNYECGQSMHSWREHIMLHMITSVFKNHQFGPRNFAMHLVHEVAC